VPFFDTYNIEPAKKKRIDNLLGKPRMLGPWRAMINANIAMMTALRPKARAMAASNDANTAGPLVKP
jgi:hypothetical protein